MNKYRDKSDFEINLRVAQIIFTDSEYDVIKQSMEVVKFQNGDGKGTCHAFDPCNNPADAMPIIIENKISLHAPVFSEGWMAENTGSDEDVNDGFQVDYFDAHNQNPCRAAMEVFLMMKDAENEKI